jgi:hypothetical protein
VTVSPVCKSYYSRNSLKEIHLPSELIDGEFPYSLRLYGVGGVGVPLAVPCVHMLEHTLAAFLVSRSMHEAR